jgi:hypothetical protein
MLRLVEPRPGAPGTSPAAPPSTAAVSRCEAEANLRWPRLDPDVAYRSTLPTGSHPRRGRIRVGNTAACERRRWNPNPIVGLMTSTVVAGRWCCGRDPRTLNRTVRRAGPNPRARVGRGHCSMDGRPWSRNPDSSNGPPADLHAAGRPRTTPAQRSRRTKLDGCRQCDQQIEAPNHGSRRYEAHPSKNPLLAN